ncbi:hypothetical protein LTR91_000039 [Friedmanniomyces endolithicus]|uniref:PH domain-containing protein n=1 Tax=Friedmanniomyces endolithicus TaxID=329885 RepID=A0AAN6FC01_9PEZI|nr:hypothetical protein LTR35_001464 [Friedmanniomyces endolithicus]KAK0297949.1 hypothetical protein LTS00_003488 [Friedmanniomyces endolithicus]KAK0310774.1 hypothetical protein LTR82_014660 [Friedmanniomyces endolithicus]KAK0921527.1 hypothetical protein LTR57_008770 [Friedmanniomyces endolithicus]KAK0999775.1 hypothetical protein LTS01_005183 [Friedmanniomyces endolithicus]
MADATSQPKRVSRYRSQRRAQQLQEEEVPEAPPIPPDYAPADSGPVRTRSRYHRKNNANGQRTAITHDEDAVDAARPTQPYYSPPVQASQPENTDTSQHQRTKSTARRYHDRHASPPAQLGATNERDANIDADGYGSEEARAYHTDSHESRPQAGREYARPLMPPSQPSGELFPPPRPEPAQREKGPVTMDGPPASNKISATKSTSELLKYADSEGDSGGCFGLFKRRRSGIQPGGAEQTLNARPSQGLQDVPVSAVNAGDRRVLVECGKSKTVFPVTWATTSMDIIKSASNCMSERINTNSAVLLEHFGSVGLQRPLRRYEHIWTIMNSWDSDRQNSFLLVDPGTGTSEIELSVAGVPRQKPGDLQWLMTYSQRLGTWDKRTVTLRHDGQITVLKDINKSKDVVSICHLSDYDIYSPTQEKTRKKIKPPKKHCFAIKSQQKSIMFETTQNFVHFFCTNDRQVADHFYAAVQGWRSWYLVNVMDEGKKSKAAVRRSMDQEAGGALRSHKPGESLDSHYQLGSFKPLLDVDQFDNRPGTAKSANGPQGGFVKSANQFDPMISPERRRSTRVKQGPQVVLGNKVLADDEPLANLNRRASVNNKRSSFDNTRPDDIAAQGLLSKTYSQRQREGVGKENYRQQHARGDDDTRRQSMDLPQRGKSTRTRPEPRTDGSGGDLRRNKSNRNPAGSGTTSGDLGRSASTRARDFMPKPLVDLSPQYEGPPQHIKKGRGHIPDQIGAGGLIEAATSPDDPIGAPTATDWRGRNAQTGSPGLHAPPPPQQPRTRSNDRRDHQPQPQQQRPPTSTSRSPHDDHGPFTGEGLMAGSHAQSGWGGGELGRGVVTEAGRGKPLLDMREPSRFVEGSLLNRIEREDREGGRFGGGVERGEPG